MNSTLPMGKPRTLFPEI